jgi:transcriptional regulator with XRE-family HTH domain
MQGDERTRIEIGARLREARERNGLTIRQLADLTGYHYSNIGKIEQGKYAVSVDVAGKIAKALGYRLEIIPGDIHMVTDEG